MAMLFTAGNSQFINAVTEYVTMRNTFTISFWIKTTQVGNDTAWQAPGVTGIEQTGGNNDIMIGIIDANGYVGICVGSGTPTDVFDKSTTIINNNAWHHVAINRDSSTGIVMIYVNGIFETTDTRATGTIGTTWTSIGKNDTTSGTDVYLNGTLDDVRVYNRVLSANEIQSLSVFRGGDDIYEGIISRYLMDESYPGFSSSGTSYDSMGSNNTTPQNYPAYAEQTVRRRRPA